jgi:hypothetical protein
MLRAEVRMGRHARPRGKAIALASAAVVAVVAGLVLLATETLGEPCAFPSCEASAASPTTTTSAAPTSEAAPPPDLTAYTGAGTWVTRYRFSPAFAGPNPPIVPEDVDAMAEAGVRVLYLQTAVDDPRFPELLETDLLAQFVARAHARDMQVVAWYLPHFTDVEADLRRLQAMVDFRASGHAFDAIGVDIEDLTVTDVDERNERLVDLSARFAEANPDVALGAIVLPPVVIDVLNTEYWPEFPWRELAPHYDVWLPMAYWSNRTDPVWSEADRYTSENIRRVRKHLGEPCAPVSVIGGYGETELAADYAGMASAAAEESAVGVSIFDWTTTDPGAWPELRDYEAPDC